MSEKARPCTHTGHEFGLSMLRSVEYFCLLQQCNDFGPLVYLLLQGRGVTLQRCHCLVKILDLVGTGNLFCKNKNW